jgi:uncharacterized membrane protein YphA (DoxX/SURF4 family)
MTAQWTALLVLAAALLTGAELLSLSAEFRAGGLVDPRYARPYPGYVLVRRVSVGRIPALARAEIALAAALPVVPLAAVPLAAVVCLQAQLLPGGRDGSDDMATVVTVALALACVARGPIASVALLFVAAQLCVCYVTSGAAKLTGPRWRSGEALVGIMRTRSYGHERVADLLSRSPTVARAVSWSVILGELALPVAIVAGGRAGIVALVLAACFQTSVAVTMGLNRFVPWYLASYPATLWAMRHRTPPDLLSGPPWKVALQVGVAGVLVLWLAATVAGQFGDRSRWLRSGPLGWALPEWRFFAPWPAEHDYRILYRTRSDGGEPGPYAPVEQRAQTWYRAVWNPAGRQQKLLRNLALNLLAAESGREPGQEPGRHHRLLLGLLPHGSAADLQFAVVREVPGRSTEQVFQSEWVVPEVEGVVRA